MFVSFIAPGPPSNVTLKSDSQQSILVFVAPPAAAQRNGIILGYTVFYRQTSLLPGASFLIVNTSNTSDFSLRLTNLTVFTEYSVKVAAFTSAGQGQSSQLQTIFSQEGSMSVPLFDHALKFSIMMTSSKLYCIIWSQRSLNNCKLD